MIISGERVVDVIYLKILIHGNNWYSEEIYIEIICPMFIIIHPKLNAFKMSSIGDFPDILCEKY